MNSETPSKKILKEIIQFIIVAIVGSVIYVIIDELTRSTLYAILAAITIILIFIIFWIYNYMSQREKIHILDKERIGMKEVYKIFNDAPSTYDIIKPAKKSVEFLGISGRTFFESEDLEEMMKMKVREGVAFKFLLLKPSSSHVDKKAKDEGDDPEAWRHDINGSHSRIERIKKETDSQNLEVRFYNCLPIWRAIFVDEQLGYITFYPHGHRGKHSPVILFENKEISLYDPLHDFFNSLWEENGEK